MKLSTLLYKANSCVPAICHDEFYRIKETLLRSRHDELFQKQITQRIEHDCWDCDGDGFDDWGTCCACEGSGLYRVLHVLHNQYCWDGHTFLLPVERCYLDATPTGWPEPEIKGSVSHKPQKGYWEATLWLLSLFDRHTFWYVFKHSQGYAEGPLSAFQRWYVRQARIFHNGFYDAQISAKKWNRIVTDNWVPTVRGDSKNVALDYALKVERFEQCEHICQSYFDAFWRSLCPSWQADSDRSAPWSEDDLF